MNATEKQPLIHFFRIRSINGLHGDSLLFNELFRLQKAACEEPDRVEAPVIRAICDIMTNGCQPERRQSLFVFRETAGFLTAVMRHGSERHAGLAFESLKTVLRKTHGLAHRAAAEALGRLPAGIPKGFANRSENFCDTIPKVGWKQLLSEAGAPRSVKAQFKGRSLVVGPLADGRLLVCKLARSDGLRESLLREVR